MLTDLVYGDPPNARDHWPRPERTLSDSFQTATGPGSSAARLLGSKPTVAKPFFNLWGDCFL